MANETYYSREITMPANKREGLANFVQIIINRLEAGEPREALMAAVDLHQDITTGVYDDAMTDANGMQALVAEMEAKHTAEIIAAAQKGREDGIAEEKARMAKSLGLLAA